MDFCLVLVLGRGVVSEIVFVLMSLKSSCARRAPGSAVHGGIVGLVLLGTVFCPFWQCHFFSNRIWGAVGVAQCCWVAQVVSAGICAGGHWLWQKGPPTTPASQGELISARHC